MPSRGASWAPAYGASWAPSAFRTGGAGGPGPDPEYPTVTGTQEWKVEGDGLVGDPDSQITAWAEDWALPDFAISGSANALKKDSVSLDESAVLWSGTQTDVLFMDRGSALTVRGGHTWFVVIKTGAFAAASTNITVLQMARSVTLSRMSLVLKREAAGDFLSWWDVSSGWLESSTMLADNTKYIISYRSNNTSLKVAVNGGAEEAIGNPTHQQIEHNNIGGTEANGEPFPGHVFAALQYNSELSDADRILVRDYFNTKYGIY